MIRNKNSVNMIKMGNAGKAIILITIIAQITVQTSCVKETLYDTDHPNHGKIISLATTWDYRGEGIDIPASYTVKIGDYSAILQGTTNSIDNLFPAGQHVIHIYNMPDNISVSGTTATANYAAGELGWLFAGMEPVTIEKDKDHAFSVDMRQEVRQLTLELDVIGDARGRITGIDATLSVAGAINIETGAPTGDAVNVTPVFAPVNGNYSATLRLLGMAGNTQTLSLTLHFRDNNPASYTLTSDLSHLLTTFNADKKTPLILKSILTVTPTQTGISATVADWMQGGVNSGTAE